MIRFVGPFLTAIFGLFVAIPAIAMANTGPCSKALTPILLSAVNTKILLEMDELKTPEMFLKAYGPDRNWNRVYETASSYFKKFGIEISKSEGRHGFRLEHENLPDAKTHWLAKAAHEIARNSGAWDWIYFTESQLFDPHPHLCSGGGERGLHIPWGAITKNKMPPIFAHEWEHFLDSNDHNPLDKKAAHRLPFITFIDTKIPILSIPPKDGTLFSIPGLNRGYSRDHNLIELNGYLVQAKKLLEELKEESLNPKADPRRMTLLKKQLEVTLDIAQDFYEVDLKFLEEAYQSLLLPNAKIFSADNYPITHWTPLSNGIRMEFRAFDFFPYEEKEAKGKQPALMAPMIRELIRRFKEIGSREIPKIRRQIHIL